MSIFVDETTKIVVQGITGKEGSFWTRHMMDIGSQVVCGVTPGKEGQEFDGVPIYHSVRRAAKEHDLEASMLFVPPRFVKDAVFEALDAGIKKIVMVAEGIPVHDCLQIRSAALSCGAMIVGGNTSGVISPGKAMLGMFPFRIERVYKPGTIGVMTRSGSLTNEVTAEVVKAGFGVSTLVGNGGDTVPGARYAEILPLFEADPETEAIVIIGELGGTMEEEVAEAMMAGEFTKPVITFMAGRNAPKGKRMGHAGAIVTGSAGSVESKAAMLKKAGGLVAEKPSMVGPLLKEALNR